VIDNMSMVPSFDSSQMRKALHEQAQADLASLSVEEEEEEGEEGGGGKGEAAEARASVSSPTVASLPAQQAEWRESQIVAEGTSGSSQAGGGGGGGGDAGGGDGVGAAATAIDQSGGAGNIAKEGGDGKTGGSSGKEPSSSKLEMQIKGAPVEKAKSLSFDQSSLRGKESSSSPQGSGKIVREESPQGSGKIVREESPRGSGKIVRQESTQGSGKWIGGGGSGNWNAGGGGKYPADSTRSKAEHQMKIWNDGAYIGDSQEGQELLSAARSRDLDAAKRLVFSDPLLLGALDRDDDMKSVLHLACEVGDEAMTRFLLRQMSSTSKVPLALTKSMREPLHLAVAAGQVRTALALVDASHFTKDARDGLGVSALHFASQLVVTESVVGSLQQESLLARTLVGAGFRTELKAMNRCEVVSGGGAEGRQQRLLAGAGDTCLHTAARGRCNETLAVLLKAGADLSRLSASGCTPLHACLTPEGSRGNGWGNWGGAGAGPSEDAGPGFLSKAPDAGEGDVLQCVRLLVEAGVGVNTKDNDGRTALMQACGMRMLEVVKHLLTEAGANPADADKRGRTALMYAVIGGNAKVVSTIRMAMTTKAINKKDEDGNSAVHFAVMMGDISCYRACVLPGVTDIVAKNKARKTPLDLAKPNSVIKLALEHAILVGNDPAMTIQRVWRGHAARNQYREFVDGLAKRQLKAQYMLPQGGGRNSIGGMGGGGGGGGRGSTSRKLLKRQSSLSKKMNIITDLDEGPDAWSMTNLHSVVSTREVEDFANRFAPPGPSTSFLSGSPQRVASTGPLSRIELLRAFENRFGSRTMFDQFCTRRPTQSDGTTPPPLIGYTQFAAMLDHTGLLGRFISRSELVHTFKRRMTERSLTVEDPSSSSGAVNAPTGGDPGGAGASGGGGGMLVHRDMQFSDFRSTMRALANRIETSCLRDIVRSFKPVDNASTSSPRGQQAIHPEASFSDVEAQMQHHHHHRHPGSAATSTSLPLSETDFDLPPPPFEWIVPSAGTTTPVQHPSDLLPTVTPVGGSRSRRDASRGGASWQHPTRSSTTSPSLTHAYKSFCDLSPTKVRVFPGEGSGAGQAAAERRRHLGDEGVEVERSVSSLDAPQSNRRKGKRGASTKKKGFQPGIQLGLDPPPKKLIDRDAASLNESLDVAAKLAQEHSYTTISALSVEALRNKIFATRNMRRWEATGCSRSMRQSRHITLYPSHQEAMHHRVLEHHTLNTRSISTPIRQHK
jgi:ankyrin repeat protein